MDKVKVRLMMPAVEGPAGEEVEVTPERAKVLINGGAAQPATKPDAKRAGVSTDTAATAKK